MPGLQQEFCELKDKCARLEEAQQFIEVDALMLPWDEENPNWIDPETIPKWTILRMTNAWAVGCQTWTRLVDMLGNPQWKSNNG